MAVDLAKVKFSPSELAGASRRVLQARGTPIPPPDGFTTGPIAEAVGNVVGTLVDLHHKRLDAREFDLRALARREVPDASPAAIRRAAERIRAADESAIREAAERLTQQLPEVVRRAGGRWVPERVTEAVAPEWEALVDLHESAAVRMVEEAELQLTWEHVTRPLP